jgi:hypothetical protein
MVVIPSKKNKIFLTDYDYRRDIENRLLMSEFSTLDVEVLEEILGGRLTQSLEELASEIDVTPGDLVPVLEKLSKASLLTFSGDVIQIDKEMRKYYDAQIEKFDHDFRPDFQYFQELLHKVPIQVLPSWYSIPKTSDNIFESIVEKILHTPRIFERYLEELQFEDKVLSGIMEDVFAAPDYRVRSKTLREKYKLTREEFEEYLLHLEFHLICCLCYVRIDNEWKEIVTPYREWQEVLDFRRESGATEIMDEESITERRPPYTYMDQMANILTNQDFVATAPEVSEMISCLELVDHFEAGAVTVEGQRWLDMFPEDRALTLYRNADFCAFTTEKALRSIEKSIRRVLQRGWVTFDDFMKGVTCALRDDAGVKLTKKGKRWRYERPAYSEADRELIRRVVFERLAHLGFVDTGVYQGALCFRVTELGKETLTD